MDAVDEAFLAHPRVDFLPARMRHRAAYDGPLEIGHGQTNSQPRTVSAMLRLLDVQPGDRVLDVGCGSGWSTALLAELTGPHGLVIGVELEPELVGFGTANLAQTSQPWARIEQADPDRLGCPDEAPFDRILVSAEAGSLPDDLVAQLTGQGRMVIPVAGTLLLVVGADDQPPTVSRHGGYWFVPLR